MQLVAAVHKRDAALQRQDGLWQWGHDAAGASCGVPGSYWWGNKLKVSASAR